MNVGQHIHACVLILWFHTGHIQLGVSVRHLSQQYDESAILYETWNLANTDYILQSRGQREAKIERAHSLIVKALVKVCDERVKV